MWSTVTPSLGSPVPCTRCKSAVCMYNNIIYVLGGRSRNQLVKDFWKYDIAEHTWVEIRNLGDGPPRLEDHTMVAWKDRLYVFGGEVSFASTGETPLWIYDIDNNSWRKKWKYNTVIQPQGCRGHTAVIFRGAMHVYGGYRDLKGSSNEFWTFDFSSETWNVCSSRNSSEVPHGRHDHSAIVHDAAMWVYGGMTNLQERSDFWRWDFDMKHWNRMKCKGGPGELHGHTACKIFSSMLLFGGEKSRQPLDALWRFHFATETWERLSLNGVLPGPRSRHSALVVPSVLLLPAEYKKNLRPRSIPCHTVLNRCYETNQRPLSSPPVPESFLPDFSTFETNSHQKENFLSSSKNRMSSNGPKHSDSHNQLNFRMIKERISNVSLLKTSYSTYSALSNSSDSVKDDELDELVEMHRNSKVKGRSMSHSMSMFHGIHPNANGHSRHTGDTISRDLLSVPNFQQLTNVVPAREAKTPQSGCGYNQYDGQSVMRESSHENMTIDRFLQYYSLVPDGSCRNGYDNHITDSEDSGIHGLKSLESNEPNNGSLFKPLPCDDQIILPGMVDNSSYTHKRLSNASESTAKRSFSVYDDFSLIDLNNEDLDHISSSQGEQSINIDDSCSKPLPSSYNEPYYVNVKKFARHKDFATCLNQDNSSCDISKRRQSGVELQTFPFQQSENQRQNSCSVNSANIIEISSTEIDNKFERTPRMRTANVNSDNGNDSDTDTQDHHFSMLVFGGREEGQQQCLIKPLVIWRCEVWR